MTLQQIKTAIERGKHVHWVNDNYEVIKDNLGQYLIWSRCNNHCIGLTWNDEKTLNGKPSQFYCED